MSIPLDTLELLGSHLLQFRTNLPRLHTCPDIKEGTLFPNFDVAVHYCMEYGRFKGFTVQKKCMEKNSDGSIHGVITPDNSPIRHYGGVIYYANTNPDIPCRNELRRRNAELP